MTAEQIICIRAVQVAPSRSEGIKGFLRLAQRTRGADPINS
jgi:hypothetical protein